MSFLGPTKTVRVLATITATAAETGAVAQVFSIKGASGLRVYARAVRGTADALFHVALEVSHEVRERQAPPAAADADWYRHQVQAVSAGVITLADNDYRHTVTVAIGSTEYWSWDILLNAPAHHGRLRAWVDAGTATAPQLELRVAAFKGSVK